MGASSRSRASISGTPVRLAATRVTGIGSCRSGAGSEGSSGRGSSGAGAAFWSRLALFVLIALYGTAAVAVFDAFWPAGKSNGKR
mgnify:CR=1 FL=1